MIKFDKFISDREQLKVALMPGGYKPPTSGHFEAFKYLLRGANSGVIFIGKQDRDGITARQSKAIWQVYSKYIDQPIEIIASPISPVKSVYDYADDHKDVPIVVGAGAKDEDIARYSYFEKNREKYPLVEVVKIPIQSGGISGTKTRELIATDIAAATEYFVPQVVSDDDKDLIRSILGEP